MIQRTFICDDCGYTANRDLNAAENIRQNGEKILSDSFKRYLGRKKKKGVA
jgi:transposase